MISISIVHQKSIGYFNEFYIRLFSVIKDLSEIIVSVNRDDDHKNDFF